MIVVGHIVKKADSSLWESSRKRGRSKGVTKLFKEISDAEAEIRSRCFSAKDRDKAREHYQIVTVYADNLDVS